MCKEILHYIISLLKMLQSPINFQTKLNSQNDCQLIIFQNQMQDNLVHKVDKNKTILHIDFKPNAGKTCLKKNHFWVKGWVGLDLIGLG